MKRIIILSTFLLIVSYFSVTGLSQVNENKNDEEVKQLIIKLINGNINIAEKTDLENKLHKLGDKGVKILVKQINVTTLKDSDFIINVFIPVVRHSFARPSEIEKDFDKQGFITLSTIKLIVDSSIDVEIRKQVNGLKFLTKQHFIDCTEWQ